MGCFDTIHLDEFHETAGLDGGPRLCNCGEPMPNDWQTKSMYSAMESYALAYVEFDGWRLEKLRVDKERFWITYSPEYIAELEASDVFQQMYAVHGGRYLDGAWDLHNMIRYSMGELPHQWIKMYATCESCKAWWDLEMRFTYGVVDQVMYQKEST